MSTCASPSGASPPCASPSGATPPCASPAGASPPCASPSGASPPCASPSGASPPCASPSGASPSVAILTGLPSGPSSDGPTPPPSLTLTSPSSPSSVPALNFFQLMHHRGFVPLCSFPHRNIVGTWSDPIGSSPRTNCPTSLLVAGTQMRSSLAALQPGPDHVVPSVVSTISSSSLICSNTFPFWSVFTLSSISLWCALKSPIQISSPSPFPRISLHSCFSGVYCGGQYDPSTLVFLSSITISTIKHSISSSFPVDHF